MPVQTVTIARGQSVTLTASPTVQGQSGGVLPGPVTWSNNGNLIGINPTMTPTGNSCDLQIPADTIGSGTFTVNASSGQLSASIIINVTPPPADGMTITAGPVS